MSMQRISVLVPPLRAVRGAIWVADLVASMLGFNAEVRAALFATAEAARRRAAVNLAERRVARDRAALIALATRYQGTQPEFAKDLFAAANNDRAH